MGAIASQITSLTIVYSIVYSDADQRNIKAPRDWPVCGNSPGPVNSPHKWPVTRKMFPFDDVIMSWHVLDFLSSYLVNDVPVHLVLLPRHEPTRMACIININAHRSMLTCYSPNCFWENIKIKFVFSISYPILSGRDSWNSSNARIRLSCIFRNMAVDMALT